MNNPRMAQAGPFECLLEAKKAMLAGNKARRLCDATSWDSPSCAAEGEKAVQAATRADELCKQAAKTDTGRAAGGGARHL